MKNNLSDLNNYLFEEIERLSDDSLDELEMDRQIKRSDAVVKIAKTIINNGSLALSMKKHLDEYGSGENYVFPLLEVSKKQI